MHYSSSSTVIARHHATTVAVTADIEDPRLLLEKAKRRNRRCSSRRVMLVMLVLQLPVFFIFVGLPPPAQELTGESQQATKSQLAAEVLDDDPPATHIDPSIPTAVPEGGGDTATPTNASEGDGDTATATPRGAQALQGDAFAPDAAQAPQTSITRPLDTVNGTCVKKERGFWTFEVCVGVEVLQFHSYQPDSATAATRKRRLSLGTHRPDRQSTNSQLFSGGDRRNCPGDVARESSVDYSCGPADRLAKVSEDTPCRYQLSVQLKAMC